MKKFALNIVMALAMLPCPSLGQSFTALWKQADEAAGKDLPKTQIEVLEKIEAKVWIAPDQVKYVKERKWRGLYRVPNSADTIGCRKQK